MVILNTSFNEVTVNQQQQHTTTKATTKQPHEAENMLKKVKDTNWRRIIQKKLMSMNETNKLRHQCDEATREWNNSKSLNNNTILCQLRYSTLKDDTLR